MTTHRRAALAVLGGQAIEVAAQAAAGVLAARALGPEAHGDLAFALSAVGMVAVLLLFGTGDVALRMHAQRTHDPSAVWGAQLTVWAGGSAVTTCLVTLLGAITGAARGALAFATLALVLNGLASAMGTLVVARERSHRDLPHVLISRALLVGGVTWAARYGGAAGVAALHGAAALTLALLRARLVRRELGSLRPRSSRAALDALWRGGRRVGVGAVFGTLAARADVTVLRVAVGAEATGLYGACYRVLNGLGALSAAAALALFPRLLRAVERGPRGPSLPRFFVAPVVLAGAAGLGAFASEPLVVALYGEPFRGAAPVLAVLLAAGMLQAVSPFVHKALIATSREASLPWAQGAQALTNLALLAWLVPQHGALGAAWATLGCELVLPVAHLVHARLRTERRGARAPW